MKSVRILVVVMLALCIGEVPAARADGGMFQLETATASLAQVRQEALLAIEADKVTYVLRSFYQGRADEFAWVIPVPDTPTDVKAHADARLFSELGNGTQPTFNVLLGGGGGGCACGGVDAGGNELGSLVEVEAQGQAGIFDWFALTGSGADALLDWLQANGFAVPDAARPILDGYIQQGMRFLAVRVREPQSGSGVVLSEVPPIQFSVATARRFYPMAISQISAAPEMEVVLYVLADHRVEAANVPNGLIDPADVAYDPASASLTNYELLFRDETARLGGLAFITEYASPAEVASSFTSHAVPTFVLLPSDWPAAPPELLGKSLYLTRIRSLIPRERMDFDLELRDAATDAGVESLFFVNAQTVAGAAGRAMPLAILLSFGVVTTLLRRASRRWPGS